MRDYEERNQQRGGQKRMLLLPVTLYHCPPTHPHSPTTVYAQVRGQDIVRD